MSLAGTHEIPPFNGRLGTEALLSTLQSAGFPEVHPQPHKHFLLPTGCTKQHNVSEQIKLIVWSLSPHKAIHLLDKKTSQLSPCLLAFPWCGSSDSDDYSHDKFGWSLETSSWRWKPHLSTGAPFSCLECTQAILNSIELISNCVIQFSQATKLSERIIRILDMS